MADGRRCGVARSSRGAVEHANHSLAPPSGCAGVGHDGGAHPLGMGASLPRARGHRAAQADACPARSAGVRRGGLRHRRRRPPGLRLVSTAPSRRNRRPRAGVFHVDIRDPREAISEYAMLQPKPSHYIVRGSKRLAEMDWAGAPYRPLYTSRDEVREVLDTIPIGVVILDERISPRRVHQELLLDVVRDDGRTWALAGTFGDRGDSLPAAVVYRRVGPIQAVRPGGQYRTDAGPEDLGRLVESPAPAHPQRFARSKVWSKDTRSIFTHPNPTMIAGGDRSWLAFSALQCPSRELGTRSHRGRARAHVTAWRKSSA